MCIILPGNDGMRAFMRGVSERSAVLRVRTPNPNEVESEAAEQLRSRMLAASLLALQLPRAKVR